MGLFLQLTVALLSSRAGVCQCPYEAFCEFLQDSGTWFQVLSVLKTTFFHLLSNRNFSEVKPEIKLYKITITATWYYHHRPESTRSKNPKTPRRECQRSFTPSPSKQMLPIGFSTCVYHSLCTYAKNKNKKKNNQYRSIWGRALLTHPQEEQGSFPLAWAHFKCIRAYHVTEE